MGTLFRFSTGWSKKSEGYRGEPVKMGLDTFAGGGLSTSNVTNRIQATNCKIHSETITWQDVEAVSGSYNLNAANAAASTSLILQLPGIDVPCQMTLGYDNSNHAGAAWSSTDASTYMNYVRNMVW